LKRIGILGGTFDPIHFGHLRTAVEMGHELGLDKVYLIPSAVPPHKMDEPVTSFGHRFHMTRLAAGDSSLLEASEMEKQRPGPSYSVETLREFRHAQGPDIEIYFIVGMDAFLEIDTWKDCRKLFDYAHFAVIPRPGYRMERAGDVLSGLGLDFREGPQPETFTLHPGNRRILLKKTTLMDISSTRIRRMVSDGLSIRFLVPETVRHYILKQGLYRRHGNT